MNPSVRPTRRRFSPFLLTLVAAAFVMVPPAVQAQQESVSTQGSQPVLPQVLSLPLARQILEQSNPDLLVAREDVAVARASVLDANLYPNPTFTYDANNVGGQGAPGAGFWDRQDLVIKIEQPILLGGKRSNRRAAAEHGVEASTATLRDTYRRQVFELERRYYSVVLGKATRELSTQILAQFDEIIALSELRYEAGESSGLELARLRTERLRFFNDRVDAELQLATAKAALLEILGADMDVDFDVEEELGFAPRDPQVAALESLALAQRPELAASRARIEQARSQYEAERADRIPNLVPFVGYNRDFGQDLWAFGASIDIPIFTRSQGGMARALAQMSREEHVLRRAELGVRRQVREAYLSMNAQAEKVTALEADYVPSALRARTIAEASYRLGALDLIGFLDAERSYRTTVRAYYASLYEHQIAVFLLDAVVAAGAQP